MATKKNMRISYPSSEKIYVPGEINKIKVGMRKIKLLDTVTLDEHGERIFKKNNPVIVYDTSGRIPIPRYRLISLKDFLVYVRSGTVSVKMWFNCRN